MTQPGAVMAAEMAEQPAALERLLARAPELSAQLRAVVPETPAGVVLLARGTSDNAAVYGRYVLEAALGVPVSLAAPSLWTRYHQAAPLSGQLLIALSQSGRTPEIESIVRRARATGATAIAITNDGESPLAQAAHEVVALEAGAELAVPATKTFTTQVAAVALIAGALARREVAGLRDHGGIAARQRELLADDACVAQVAQRLAAARAVVTIGSGYLYAVALEGALKLLETTSLPVLSYSASDFLHGPVAVAAPDVPIICFAAPGPVLEDVRAAAAAAARRGAPVVWVGEDSDLVPEAVLCPSASGGVAEPLAPLLHAVRAQQLALAVSRALGRDPDAPSGLRKVTPTE